MAGREKMIAFQILRISFRLIPQVLRVVLVEGEKEVMREHLLLGE